MTERARVPDSPWRTLPGLDQLLVAPSDPAGFMAALLDMLAAIPGIDAAWIGRPNDDGILLPEVARAPAMAVLTTPSAMIDLYEGARSRASAGRAWRSGVAAMSSDVSEDDTLAPWREDWARFGLRVGVSIPLNGVGGVHRILNLYSREPAFFETTWPLSLLTEFGLVIGTAIENRVNHQALQRSNRLLDTLMAGVDALLDPASETAVLRGICKRLSETGLFICAAIGRVDRNGMFGYPIAAGKDQVNVRRLQQKIDQSGPHQLLGLAAWKTGTLQTADDYASASRLEPWRHIAVSGGWRSAAAAPIRRAGTMFAVLFLVADATVAIDPGTQRLIGQLASNVGRALDEIDLKAALRAEREIQSRFARHDELTDLPNRRAFEETLPAALAHATSSGAVLGLGILDLDNFKPINDRHGHAAGDIVLRTLGRRLRAALREIDFVARLGGDEFALIIDGLTSRDRLDAFCTRLGDMIAQPITIAHGEAVVIAASLGLTFFPSDAEPPDTLIRHADMALYAAKAAKRVRSRYWMTYQEHIGVAPAQSHCRKLLANGGVEVHYQPVIAVRNGRVTAIEALARLRDGERLLAPAAFLPELNAEDREVLLRDVLTQGVACLRHLAIRAPALQLSINVDAEVLVRGQVPAIIAHALAGTGIAPSRIIVELLESHDFADHETAHRWLTDLRRTGVIIAIDDLGIEFSTLKRVQRLPVDHLKIDKVFLADVMQNPNDLVFLTSYITMAASLGLTLCVEGVETIDMLDALRILGTPLAQGFGIARPMPRADLETWFDHKVPAPIKGAPRTLLGAYALHLRWLRVFLFAPTDTALWHYLRRESEMSLTPFLRRTGLDPTPLGKAYSALMTLTDQPELDIAAVALASDQVRTLLAEAVVAAASAPVAATIEPALQPRKSLPKRPVRQSRSKRLPADRLDAHPA